MKATAPLNPRAKLTALLLAFACGVAVFGIGFMSMMRTLLGAGAGEPSIFVAIFAMLFGAALMYLWARLILGEYAPKTAEQLINSGRIMVAAGELMRSQSRRANVETPGAFGGRRRSPLSRERPARKE